MDPRLPFASPRAGMNPAAASLAEQIWQTIYNRYVANWSDTVQRYGMEAITDALQPLNVGASPFDVGGNVAAAAGAASNGRARGGDGGRDGFYRGANVGSTGNGRLDNRLSRATRGGGRDVPGGSFQDLAGSWNSDAIRAAARADRKAARADRRADRGERGANADASGGTFTHGDIDAGTKLTVDVSGGRAVSRGNEKPRKKKREADYG